MLRPCLVGQVATKIGGSLTVSVKGNKHAVRIKDSNLKVGERVCIQMNWGTGKIIGLSHLNGDIYQVEEELPPEDEFDEVLFDVPDQEQLASRSFSGTEEYGDQEGRN